jgi:hypothetical protein
VLRAAQGRAAVQGSCGVSRLAYRLRREQAKSRAALEESALFTLPGGKQVLKLAPLAEWTTRDVWYACEQLSIPLLPLYERGYSSIGCEPCTSLPLDPNDPRSGRWAGRKVECGIHIRSSADAIELARRTGVTEMQYIIGFIIALFIALHRRWRGHRHRADLVLFLGVPRPSQLASA